MESVDVRVSHRESLNTGLANIQLGPVRPSRRDPFRLWSDHWQRCLVSRYFESAGTEAREGRRKLDGLVPGRSLQKEHVAPEEQWLALVDPERQGGPDALLE